MRKSLLAGVSLGAVALASGAQAADLGARPVYKAPPLLPAPWSWTGFYLGANLGAARLRSSVSDDVAADLATGLPPWIGAGVGGSASADTTGIIGGLQAGYNWQWTSLVVGIEGDISFASLDRTVTGLSRFSGGIDTYRSRLEALGTVRGRIGWAFDRVLVYGTGGAAFASLKNEYTDPPSVIGFISAPSSSVTGWTAGGGIEYAFTDHWTAKAEYLHVGFPDRSVTTPLIFGGAYTFNFKNSLDIGRVGINYKF